MDESAAGRLGTADRQMRWWTRAPAPYVVWAIGLLAVPGLTVDRLREVRLAQIRCLAAAAALGEVVGRGRVGMSRCKICGVGCGHRHRRPQSRCMAGPNTRGMTEETGGPRASARGATTDGRWLLAVLLVSFPFPACDRPEPRDPAGTEAGFAVRDSSGIEIVENHYPVYPPERFWRMDMEPEIVLGGSDRWLARDSAHLIWRVSGLARLEDGRVAVLSRGNRQLYLFEPDGELSRVMGGAGRGPGEFGGPAELQYLPPDTLAVWDSWFGPVSYFDTDGDLIRTRSVDLGKVIAGANRVTAESRRIPLADGSFVTIVSRGEVPLRPLVGTAFRQPIEIVRVDQEYAARRRDEGRDPSVLVGREARPDHSPLYSSAAGFGRRTPGMADLLGDRAGPGGSGSRGAAPASDSQARFPSPGRRSACGSQGILVGLRVVCIGGGGTRPVERLQPGRTVARSAPGAKTGSAVQ